MKIFERALEGIKYAIGLLLLAGVILNFVNICLRYVWGQPFSWTEEVMGYGMLFIVMAGLVVATAFDQNLKIDILVQTLPRNGQKLLKLFSLAVWAGVSIYLATQSYTVMSLMLRLGQTSMAARIPTWIPHSFVFAAFSLSALAAAYAFVKEIQSKPAEMEDHMSVAPGTIVEDNDKP